MRRNDKDRFLRYSYFIRLRIEYEVRKWISLFRRCSRQPLRWGKTAAKKTGNNLSDDSVEDVPRDQAIDFKHGNTGYEAVDPDKEKITAQG